MPRSRATSRIGRGLTERAISRSDGNVIDLLRSERGGGARADGRGGPDADTVEAIDRDGAAGPADEDAAAWRSNGACRSAARIRWLSRSALVSGPTPPGTGRDGRGDLDRAREVDVADDVAVDDVDPDVDDDRAAASASRR